MSRAVEQYAPVIGRLEAGQHAQQRGLAAARGSEQSEEFVLADVERNAVDGGHPAEILRHMIDGQQRARFAHWPMTPRLSRCDRVSAVMLTAMTMVASALISGVMPKRIIA